MSAVGIDDKLEQLLHEANSEGGFTQTLLASADGLVLAASGSDDAEPLDAAAFCSLFDEAFARASDHLGFERLDELALRDGKRGRYIVRPLTNDIYLVARVPPGKTWRKVTNTLCRKLRLLLDETKK